MPVLRAGVQQIRAEQAEQRRADRGAVREFAEAVLTSDPVRCADAMEAVSELGQWKEAMRAIAGLSPSKDFRIRFASVWVATGDGFRSDVTDDLILIDAMRALLPRYTGPAVTLYRGDGAINRRRRTYGLSWSAAVEVARAFAVAHAKLYDGGSVLLETVAPPEAIVCSPGAFDDRYAEQEFLVDRRRLRSVKVLERFAYAPMTPRSGIPKPASLGTRFEIAVNGKSCGCHDDQATAVEKGRIIKSLKLKANVIVRDRESGETIIIESAPFKSRSG